MQTYKMLSWNSTQWCCFFIIL